MNLKKSDAPETCYPGSEKGSWQKKKIQVTRN